MVESAALNWILGIVIPTVISVATFWTKLSKEKVKNENRISIVESKIKAHENDLKEIKEDIKSQREDLKLLPELKAQGKSTLDAIKEIKEDLRKIK